MSSVRIPPPLKGQLPSLQGPGQFHIARRRQYEAARPWKNGKLTRKKFVDLLAILPDDFVEHVRLEADAERLIAAAFGNGG